MGWWVGGVDWWMGWIGGLVWTGGLVDWWSGSLQLGVRRFCKSLLTRATAMGRRIIIIIIILLRLRAETASEELTSEIILGSTNENLRRDTKLLLVTS